MSSAPELARLTLNVAKVHHDETDGAPGRLVYGGHTIGIALHQAIRALTAMVTVVGWHGCDHVGPVREGDTLTSVIEVERTVPWRTGLSSTCDRRYMPAAGTHRGPGPHRGPRCSTGGSWPCWPDGGRRYRPNPSTCTGWASTECWRYPSSFHSEASGWVPPRSSVARARSTWSPGSGRPAELPPHPGPRYLGGAQLGGPPGAVVDAVLDRGDRDLPGERPPPDHLRPRPRPGRPGQFGQHGNRLGGDRRAAGRAVGRIAGTDQHIVLGVPGHVQVRPG